MKDFLIEIVVGIGEGVDLMFVLCDSWRKGLLCFVIDEFVEVKCFGLCLVLVLGVVFWFYLFFVVFDFLCFWI